MQGAMVPNAVLMYTQRRVFIVMNKTFFMWKFT